MSVFDNMKAASGTGTASGTFPIIKNSANGKMKNLKLFGASTKAEGQIESVVLKGVTATGKNLFGFGKNAIDKTSELRPQFTQQLILSSVDNNPNKIKCVFNNGTWSVGFIEISGLDGTKDYSISYNIENNTTSYKPSFEIRPTYSDTTKLILQISANNGNTTMSDTDYFILSDIQVEAGTAATEFEPFKANIANLPEAIELNGIDEVKDYIDYERGVFVQKFGVAVLDGSEDEGLALGTTANGLKRMQINISDIKPASNVNVKTNILCDSYITTTAGENYMENEGIAVTTSNLLYVYDARFKTSSVSEWKAHFAANPITIVYELEEPIETPLSPAALLELNKLRTFDSTTCVSNDAGAEMEIEYFKNNATGQAMSDIHAGVPRFVLDGTTLNIIV